jgi:hypothetical protein
MPKSQLLPQFVKHANAMLYCVCVLLTCGAVVTLRAVEFAPLGGIRMPMCIGLGVAATATHRVQMLVGLRLYVRLG